VFWQAVIFSRVVAKRGLTQAGLCTGCVLRPGIAALSKPVQEVGACWQAAMGNMNGLEWFREE
jgi:hypothetical protein